MKYLLFALLMMLGTTAFVSDHQPIKNQIQLSATLSECHHGQCQAIAKSTGNRCKHCVSNKGDRFCYQHK